ncbi:MAG: hypothetical protein ACI85O_002437, partial [Saprospiraceae bacterium]
LKNSSVVQTMQRFLKENYRKNLALKFIRINNVTYLFEDSIPYLVSIFYEKCYSFNDFYINSLFEIKVDDSSYKYKEFLKPMELMRIVSEVENIISQNTKQISLEYSFKEFKKVGFDNKNYFSFIRFNFENTQFKISSNGSKKTTTHFYLDWLTKNEMEEILKSITTEHQTFIENILKEIKDKN